jgi:hypothetical protein
MATDGLSLVGFFSDQHYAINHLRVDCVAPIPTDAALIAVWQAAQARIGPTFNHAPAAPLPMSATTQPHMQALLAQPWLTDRLAELNAEQTLMGLPPASFQSVFIDALLAFQFVVDVDRSTHHCTPLSNPPTEAQLLNLCLPITQPYEDYYVPPMTPQSSSAIIKLRNHNLQMHRWGVFDGMHGEKVAGVSFQVGLPFVHVTRFNGRCYLYNGYHRTYGARMAGATHIPCIFRDVSNAQAAGIRSYEGGTFPEVLLTSVNPPTMAHFTGGRAQAVRVREKSRVIHVTWHQYSVPDEYE